MQKLPGMTDEMCQAVTSFVCVNTIRLKKSMQNSVIGLLDACRRALTQKHLQCPKVVLHAGMVYSDAESFQCVPDLYI
jgi:hypothetical protein